MPEADEDEWVDLGPVDALRASPLQQVVADKLELALSYKDGAFAAISGVCNHVGGPLGEGSLDGDYVVCPWHHWKFHRETGVGEPGSEDDHARRVARARHLAGRKASGYVALTGRRGDRSE